MSGDIKKGDVVSWKFQSGETHGTIEKIHTKPFEFLGKHHEARADEPMYEVRSTKTGKSAVHKATALQRSAGKH